MDISTSKTTVKPVKEDVVRPAELREKVVEMGSRTGNDDNVPEQFNVDEARVLFEPDGDNNMDDIVNLPTLKKQSVNELLPKTNSSQELKDHRHKTRESIKTERRKSHYGRTFKQRQEILEKRRRASHKGVTKKDLLLSFTHKKAHGSRNVGGHPPHDKEAYDSIEAIDYSTPDTVQETDFLKSQDHDSRKWRGCFLWTLYFFFGVIISVVITYTLLLCDIILNGRVYLTTESLNTGAIGSAWCAWVGTSLALCLGAAFCVLVEPAAASSGIPGLLAYLNGVTPKAGKSFITGKDTDFLSYQTMFSKLVGMIFSIPSGLCIGPEGPIIHISALLARWIGKIMHEIEHKLFPDYAFRTKKSEARDFLATGGGCGIAAAFRAPLSGVLFVVEEASSHFKVKHLEQTFWACIMCYFVGYTIYQPEEGFSKFALPQGKFCFQYDSVMVLFFAIIAVLGGIIGAFFNQVVEELNHWRVENINKSAWRRVAEVAFICLLTGSCAVLLPAAWPCREMTPALMTVDSTGCHKDVDTRQLFKGTIKYEAMESMYGEQNISALPAANQRMLLNARKYRVPKQYRAAGKTKDMYDDVYISKEAKNIKVYYAHKYTCKGKYEYNEMAGLWLNGGVKSAKKLMERGFPTALSWHTLLVFFIVYFILAALTAGISVPAGLVIPMMLMGGSFGRLVGLVAMEWRRNNCPGYENLDHDLASSNMYYWTGSYRWTLYDCTMPDPGTYAIIGMAAIMGGSGRITMMLAAVLLELTADPLLIAPIGGTCIVAMLVGNSFNHGLYHGLIPVFNLPYLNMEPSSLMWISKVEEVMTYHPISIKKIVSVKTLEKFIIALQSGVIKHNAFPVVSQLKDGGPHDLKLQGLITRQQLYEAYETAQYEAVMGFMNLYNYMERSPLTVYPHTRLGRAYEVFQKLGLRHMPVIKTNGCIVGILTRKNLQTYLLHKNASLARIQAVFRGKLARIRRRLALEKLHAKKTFRLDSTSSKGKTDNSKKNE